MSDASFPSGGPESKATLSRVLRILLIASLALNMFALGAGAMMLGRHMHHPERGPGMMRHAEFPGPNLMLRALSKETRERIEAEIAPEKAAMRAAMETGRTARRAALAAFSAQPYSSEAYEEKRKASEEADIAAVRAAHALLAKVSASLTPEERASMIDAMKNRRFGPSFKDELDRSPPGGPPPAPDGG